MTLVRGRALGGTIWQAACQLPEGEIAMADRPNILFFHVDNLGYGELSCYSGGPLRGTWTRRIDAFAGQGSG
jgi:hypothetical protein